METIGERLKKVRLEKGRSLEDAHRDTKIHFNVLRALEEDSLVNYNPVYVRGFLKIYCHYLGVNSDEFIIEAKKSKFPVEAISEVKKQPLPDNKPPAFIPAAGTFLQHRKVYNTLPKPPPAPINRSKTAGTENLLWLSPKVIFLKFIRGKIKIIIGIAIIFLLLMGVFKIGKFMILKIGQWSKRPKTEAAAKTSKEHAIAVKTKDKVNVSSGIKLTIRAKDNCWMQVKSDGKNIFQGILRKGRVECWKANERIELSVGNAGVLELEVNGKIISSLGRKGQAVKNIIITKDGLTTSR